VNNGGGSSPIEATTTAATPRLRIDSGPGTDTITVPATHPASPVTVLPAPGDDRVNVGGSGALARLAFDQSQRIGALTVGSAGRAEIVPTPAGEVVLTMAQLTITGTGAFDLADGSAVIDHGGASPASAVRTYLANGFNNGAWNGSGGILSSAAAGGTNTGIGYAEKTDLPAPLPPQFAGQAIDDTALLLTHTLYGDADLNRTVNLGDFNRLAASFGQSARRWSHGDFDYNGSVNLSDFNRLAASFGQTLARASGSRLLDELR
jgi:hypothetical protein